MKKRIFVCSVIAICLAIAAYGSVAFFTHEETATNVITMGNVKIELQELAIPSDGGDAIPFNDVIDILPGTDISKIVQIKNIGANPAWIRISVETAIDLADGATGTADTSLITFDINTSNWIEKDGYFYYNQVLTPGEITVPLFTKVSFSPAMGNLYQQSKATVVVTAHATQSQNNGDSVLTAAGWPNAE